MSQPYEPGRGGLRGRWDRHKGVMAVKEFAGYQGLPEQGRIPLFMARKIEEFSRYDPAVLRAIDASGVTPEELGTMQLRFIEAQYTGDPAVQRANLLDSGQRILEMQENAAAEVGGVHGDRRAERRARSTLEKADKFIRRNTGELSDDVLKRFGTSPNPFELIRLQSQLIHTAFDPAAIDAARRTMTQAPARQPQAVQAPAPQRQQPIAPQQWQQPAPQGQPTAPQQWQEPATPQRQPAAPRRQPVAASGPQWQQQNAGQFQIPPRAAQAQAARFTPGPPQQRPPAPGGQTGRPPQASRQPGQPMRTGGQTGRPVQAGGEAGQGMRGGGVTPEWVTAAQPPAGAPVEGRPAGDGARTGANARLAAEAVQGRRAGQRQSGRS